MLDYIQKGLLTGVGLASLTVEKADALVKELIKKGEMSEKEGKDLADDLMKKSEQAGKDLEKKMGELVHKALAKLDVAMKADVAALEKRIKDLEAQLAGKKGE